VNPFVAVGVVEVPVGVDEDADGFGVDGGEGGSELGLAGGVAGVDEELACFGGEDGDVPAGSAEKGDVAAEGSGGDFVVGIGGAGLGEEVLRLLGEEAAGVETGCGRGCSGGREEAAASDRWRWLGHENCRLHG
jgi:hypothetical protein